MEKTVKRLPLHGAQSDTEYWLSRSPEERLAAVEHLRQEWLAFHPDAVQRLQRVCRTVKRARG